MTAPAFNEKAAPLSLMTPAQYQSVLENLVANGTGWGKTKQVGAYLLQDVALVTETSSGKVETTKNVAVEKLYVTMDTDTYPREATRNLIVEEIARKWGKKNIKERDLADPDFSGPGLWTLKKGAFEGDYKPVDPKGNTYNPDPNAYRVVTTTAETVKMPVQWGDFTVEAGGAFAIRQKDIPALAEALAAIKAGTTTAEEALYAKDAKGNTVSKFDIYGMEPGFLEKNYGAVALTAETTAIQASFKPAKPKAAGLKNG